MVIFAYVINSVPQYNLLNGLFVSDDLLYNFILGLVVLFPDFYNNI